MGVCVLCKSNLRACEYVPEDGVPRFISDEWRRLCVWLSLCVCLCGVDDYTEVCVSLCGVDDYTEVCVCVDD